MGKIACQNLVRDNSCFANQSTMAASLHTHKWKPMDKRLEQINPNDYEMKRAWALWKTSEA
eukprot:1081725-Amphidinium_carterae.1